MGLLSDPEYGSVKWVRILKKVNKPLCFLCYVGALVWFVMLGHRQFNNETYFSENALLPGLVSNEFNGEYAAKQYYNELLQELEDKYGDNGELPVPWLVGKMSQLHLEVYTHNFSLNYPLGHGERQVYKGTNVYGILRAARSPSLEALVVSAPYRSLGSHQKGTAAGIALMLAFAQFARPQKYWAKDIIFLVTEHEQLGMQAWLEAYHGLQSKTETFYTSLGSFWKPDSPSLDFSQVLDKIGLGSNHQKCLNPGTLRGRSGSIQAAINLELHDPKILYIEVKIEGLNGQLPNLDLVNLVHKLCLKSGIHHSYKNSFSWIRYLSKVEDWVNNIWTMLGMVSTQIAGVPNGNHGLFHRFGIEAVTLEGRDAGDAESAPRTRGLSPANFHRLGATLESILRSLNNLLERFHQSYFFYVLAATNRFVSIGQYMPSLCLPCVAMLIRALSLWVTIQPDSEDKTDEKSSKKDSDSEESAGHENEESVSKPSGEESTLRHRKKASGDKTHVAHKTKARKKAKRSVDADSMSIVTIGSHYLFVHFLGYGVMNTPVLLNFLGSYYFDLNPEVSVYYGLILISACVTLAAPFLLRIRKGRITREELSLVNILVLIELVTVCLTVGMQNFSLGLALTALYTPLALVVNVAVKDGRKLSSLLVMLKRVFCLVCHPLALVTLGLTLYSSVLFPEEGWLSRAGRGSDAAMQALMFSIVDSMIYGNWLFNVAAAALFPIWIIFWQILCNPVVA